MATGQNTVMEANGQGGAPRFGFAHVFDPKLQAGRGEEFSAARQAELTQAAMQEAREAGDDFHLPMGRVEDSLDTDGLQQASLEAPIPATNRGYAMLRRMGWSAGKGLGAAEDGIVEPVRGGMEAGLRLGLGKAEQEQFYIDPENVTRKRLEVEVQADEDYERTLKREMAVERGERIKSDTSEAKRNLYCTTCNKQYKNAMEMETHLSSYDHHHTKRLQEMRQATAERTRSERERKERRRAEKEWAKLNAQAARAQQSQGGAAGPAALPPPPDADGAPPPPPPPDTGGDWQQPQAHGGWQTAPAAAPPLPPPEPGGWQQPQAPGGWQTTAAAAPLPPDSGGWQQPTQPHDWQAAPGSSRPQAASGRAGSVGSGGKLHTTGRLTQRPLPAKGMAFGGTKPAVGAVKQPGFGSAVAKRQAVLKPTVAGFGLDDSDEEAAG